MSIMSHNGSAVLAMKGKDCVGIGSDLRFGVQLQTISMDFEKCFRFGQRLFVGLSGLSTDIQTVSSKLKARVNTYELNENRRIRPVTLLNVASNLLYEKRFGPFFVEPIVAGLDEVTNEPFIGSTDLIGCTMEPEDFVVSGTCTEQMYGMCESLWKPDMGPDELFKVMSQSLLNAVDRDAVSGWGAVVYIIEKDQVTRKVLKCRMD